jgi:uncharacterized protein with HEPN domain
MQPDERDAAYLWDMLDSARALRDFAANVSFHSYAQDKKLQFAIERALEIIGEAARRVSETYRQTHPEIPWQSIIAQRNVLAHEYGEIKQELIWRVATIRIPELIDMLEQLVPSPPGQTI